MIIRVAAANLRHREGHIGGSSMRAHLTGVGPRRENG
jgi:hypothetical protein